jgi:uncharacterized membrane protein
MKATISSVFHKVGSLFRKIGFLFRRIASLFRRVASLFRKIASPFRRVVPLFRKVASLFGRVGPSLHNGVSLLGRPIRKLRLLPPWRRIDRALHAPRKTTREPKYRFLAYVTGVLRVLGWVVLVVGVLASILFGLQILNGGLMIGETELRGVGTGASAIVLGIISSFLAWLFLLVGRELICLFIRVKENTGNTAESIT